MPKTQAEISGWCIRYLSNMLNRPEAEIEPETSFPRIGLDSAMAIYFVTDLEEWIGFELSPEIAFEHPSIAALSAHLAGVPGSAGA